MRTYLIFLMIQRHTQKHIFAQLIVLKGSNGLNDKKKPSIISQELHCLNFCQIRLSYSDSEEGVANSETHKHSGFGLARWLCSSPVDWFGSFISCQRVYSRALSGLHADQNLFHHRQLLESHIVLQSLIKKKRTNAWECSANAAIWLPALITFPFKYLFKKNLFWDEL